MDKTSFRSYRTSSLIDHIKQDLQEKIVSGGLKPGEQLPSEHELAELFNVSRNSIREAIGLLENEGYLIRRQGIGTFITYSDPIIKGGIERLKGISEFIREKGYTPGSMLENFSLTECDESISEALMIDHNEKVVFIETIKTASGTPVASCTDIIPLKFLTQPIAVEDLKEPIFDYLQKKHNIKISFAECDLIPSVSDDVLSSKLKLETGRPVLLLEQIHYDDEGRRVLFSRSFFPANRFSFKLIRRR
jgi:GntR family transcriptional regulator